jgi:hypothetical protein
LGQVFLQPVITDPHFQVKNLLKYFQKYVKKGESALTLLLQDFADFIVGKK